MMNQTIIFIDAGFLLSLGGHRAAGTTLRSAVTIHYESLVRGIVQTVKKNTGLNNLRVYWYDASKDGLFTEQHKRIGFIPGVKVRLGRISYNGEQKGVDLRLALDLVGVARHGAASVAYLVSGDDDLAEAVEEAQDLGMKVILLGVRRDESRLGVASVAEHLALTADAIETIPDQLLDSSFTKVIEWDDQHASESATIAAAPTETVASEAEPAAPTPAIIAQRLKNVSPEQEREQITESEVIYSSGGEKSGFQGKAAYEQEEIAVAQEIGANVANSWLASTTQLELVELMADRPQLPPEIDRTLLKDCAQVIGDWKTDQQQIRRVLRGAFWSSLDKYT
ncbi:NYN domain-containing protein [Glutamicibacter creatinolyticus]|uniref:NYN domain-containing protein n=1 Tax=Glutamicibacter creatinolyticus TaxID=162496 RepID=UPI0031D125BD